MRTPDARWRFRAALLAATLSLSVAVPGASAPAEEPPPPPPDGAAIAAPSPANGEQGTVRERLARHGFPKLFVQIMDYLPGRERMAGAAWFDIVIADCEVASNQLAGWVHEILGPQGQIRTFNADAVVPCYFSAGDYIPGASANSLNGRFQASLEDAWILHDVNGDPFRFFQITNTIWTIGLNISTPVAKFMPQFLYDEVVVPGLVDGLFYDWIEDDVSWMNQHNSPSAAPDVNNDGQPDSDRKLTSKWRKGTRKLLRKSQAVVGDDRIVLGNSGGKTQDTYGRLIDGLMHEAWYGTVTLFHGWGVAMRTYHRHLSASAVPGLSLLMSNGPEADYRRLRFSLASALMFDGYFTYQNETGGGYLATWWYDEYSVDLATGRAVKALGHKGWLGAPRGDAYAVDDNGTTLADTLDNDVEDAERHAWRRDFENGVVLVNPTDHRVKVRLGPGFRRIRGTVDPAFNDGSKVKRITLRAESGAVFLRR